jgi:cysteine desulfurase
VEAEKVAESLRPDTALVSVMHANNETGVIQPIEEIAKVLANHDAYFHVDAAQSFGKCLDPLQLSRVDLISVSAHKIFGPKGVGALITRRRGFNKIPLEPLMFGGGQERGLRPGTLPVALIAAFGAASKLAYSNHAVRTQKCLQFRTALENALLPLGVEVNGDPARTLPHIINLSFPGLNSETLMITLKRLIAISNGSACTSSSYTLSHVLKAMGLAESRISQAVRFSWCHLTPLVDWQAVSAELKLHLACRTT